MFTTDTGRPLDPTSSPQKHFRRILQAAGLAAACKGMRPYDLKHSCVSILLDAGMPRKAAVAEGAGISVEVLLAHYAQSHPDAQMQATVVLDRALAQ